MGKQYCNLNWLEHSIEPIISNRWLILLTMQQTSRLAGREPKNEIEKPSCGRLQLGCTVLRKDNVVERMAGIVQNIREERAAGMVVSVMVEV